MDKSVAIDHIAKAKQAASPYILKLRHFYDEMDKPTLVIGLAIVLGIYAALFSYAFMRSDKTIAEIESRLASETLSIAYMAKPAIHNSYDNTPSDFHDASLLEGLHVRENDLLLPIIRPKDLMTSFRAYQTPFTPEANIVEKPIISFVLMDYGLSTSLSEAALDLLPPEVAFVLSPYTPIPNEWIKMARDKGHEVWLNIPIQNEQAMDLGVNTIYHHAAFKDKQAALYKTLARAQGYVGLASFVDSSLTQQKDDYNALIEDIYKRGLGYLELNPELKTSPFTTKALTLDAPYLHADMTTFKITGKHSFTALESIAHRNQYALAVVPSYYESIKNLSQWLLKVAEADYTIAPASAFYDIPKYLMGSENQSDTEYGQHE